MRLGPVPPSNSAVILAPVLALALASGGCEDPYERDARLQQGGGARQERATSTPEPARVEPSPTPTPGATPDGGGTLPEAMPQDTPEAAARAFAQNWANWTWKSFEENRRELAALATGAYLGELTAPSDQPEEDLARLRPYRRGRIEALQLRPGSGRQRSAVVVLREQQRFEGSPADDGYRWVVYLATLRRIRGGWLVAAWEEQS